MGAGRTGAGEGAGQAAFPGSGSEEKGLVDPASSCSLTLRDRGETGVRSFRVLPARLPGGPSVLAHQAWPGTCSFRGRKVCISSHQNRKT